MPPKKIRVGLVGCGQMAKCHVWAIANLKYYYDGMPQIDFVALTSSTKQRGETFAARFGIASWVKEVDFWPIPMDYLVIASPCSSHFHYLTKAMMKEGLAAIYVEKPLLACAAEVEKLAAFLADPEKRGMASVHVGFQFLQLAALQKARELLPELGRVLHFEARYLHSGYLQKSYREARQTRLLPAPLGGVCSDLASHVFSLCVAFFGKELRVTAAQRNERFHELDENSDLFMHALLHDGKSGAVGSVTASRISAGHGDSLSFEIYAEKGALRYSSERPECLELFRERHHWEAHHCSNGYKEHAGFPSSKAAAGQLRSLVHAHFLALDPKRASDADFISDLSHGMEVQRLVHDSLCLAAQKLEPSVKHQ